MKDYGADPSGGLTIDELADVQNVKPMADVRALFGTWPGKKDDGFEEAINELRYGDLKTLFRARPDKIDDINDLTKRLEKYYVHKKE